MNEALKTKWLWRYAKKVDALWKKVIVSKYGAVSLGWWSTRSPYAHGAGSWKFIHARLDLFRSLVCFKRRNGSRVLF